VAAREIPIRQRPRNGLLRSGFPVFLAVDQMPIGPLILQLFRLRGLHEGITASLLASTSYRARARSEHAPGRGGGQ